MLVQIDKLMEDPLKKDTLALKPDNLTKLGKKTICFNTQWTVKS